LELLEIERSLRSTLGIETTGTVKVIIGRFKNKLVNCSVTACAHANQRWFRIPEEKRTDVNIAESVVDDACQYRCDHLVLISGDSDLVPAVAVLRERFPQEESYRYDPSRDPTR
jgi:6-hydroxy-3-succinoylpyridine 3-monooxygenase